MGGSGGVLCKAGVWTTVIKESGIVSFKATSHPNTKGKWRRYCVGIPPYLEGTFNGAASFPIFGEVYAQVDLLLEHDARVDVEVG